MSVLVNGPAGCYRKFFIPDGKGKERTYFYNKGTKLRPIIKYYKFIVRNSNY